MRWARCRASMVCAALACATLVGAGCGGVGPAGSGPASPGPPASAGWERSPDQAALAGIRLESVVWTGSRFVAISDELEATALDSSNGQTWHRQPAFGITAWTEGPSIVAAGPGGVVAVGGGNGGPLAIWHSDDGLTWSTVPDQPALYAEDGLFEHVAAVIADGDGWFAVGGESITSVTTPLVRAVVLTSADGIRWTREPDSAALDRAEMTGVVRGPESYLAVGNALADQTGERSSLRPATWTSPDGRTWTRQSAPPAFDMPAASGGGEPVDLVLEGVAFQGERFVAVGGVDRHDGRPARALAWWSEGGAWTPVETGAIPDVSRLAIKGLAGGFAITGGPAAGCSAGTWISSDSSAWICAGDGPPFAGYVVVGVAASPGFEVRVGYRLADPPVGAAWRRAL
jgi:hypothetical protein